MRIGSVEGLHGKKINLVAMESKEHMGSRASSISKQGAANQATVAQNTSGSVNNDYESSHHASKKSAPPEHKSYSF